MKWSPRWSIWIQPEPSSHTGYQRLLLLCQDTFHRCPLKWYFLLTVLSHVSVTSAHSLSTLVVLAEDLRSNCFLCFYQVWAACVPDVSVLPYLEGLLSDCFQDASVWWRSCKSVCDSCVSLLVISLIPFNFHILAPISPVVWYIQPFSIGTAGNHSIHLVIVKHLNDSLIIW